MVRGLWRDCAAHDLMTLADFVGLRLEATGADDPLVALMVELIDRLPASADHKRYAGQRLAQAGVGAAVVERLQSAWRAIQVAPVPVPGSALHAAQDPEPPPSEPRVDEWLTAFAEGDEHGIELARVVIDEMFEASPPPPPPGLAWWTVATVDAVPPRRRRRDIAWVLIHLGTLLRKQHGCAPPVSPSTLMRWLDTPQLLDATGTRIALELLARLQPALVLQRCLHRAVSASDEALPTAYHAALMVGGLWRALVAAEPSVVLQLVSRWLAFGFGAAVFVECLLQLLAERGLQQPGLVDTLAASLVPSASLPPEVIDMAHQLLDNLHQLPPPEPPP
ncbi:MAG: hypothetical protein Q7U26_11100, partial [Aquabacterium sp.]|nr:hypothetical protein [Aquabacterium sp.]